MRHAIANGLYTLAGAIDKRAGKLSDLDLGLEFGDKPVYGSSELETVTMNFHSKPNSQVNGQFKPGSFTYASLSLGNYPQSITIFLNRRFTRRLIDVLKGLEGAYARFGEDRPS